MDAYKNLALTRIAVPPSPPTTGTSLTLVAGHGARLPVVPFNATVWDGFWADPENAEIVRVVARVGDVLTIVRTQEPPPTARAIRVDDFLAATFTEKFVADVRDSSNQNAGTLPDARLSANVQLKPIGPGDLPSTVATKPVPQSDVTNLVTDLAAKAPLASPALTGTPSAPTAAPGTSTTQIATTAFVTSADATKAPLASPALTGTPTAPTAAPGTSTTQIATTAFVTSADATKAPLASPALTGTPTAPTASFGTSTTQIATTAFVANALVVVPVHHTAHEPGGSDALTALSATTLTSGTLPDARLSSNIPRLNLSNVFTGSVQEIGTILRTRNPSGAVDHRLWQILHYVDGQLFFQALNDAGTTDEVLYPMVLSRIGNLKIFSDYFEKNRGTAMGHWLDVPYNAANFFAGNGMWTVTSGQIVRNRYTLIGKSICWQLMITGSSLTASNPYVFCATPLVTFNAHGNGNSRVSSCVSAGVVMDKAYTVIDPGSGNLLVAVPSGTTSFAAGFFDVEFTAWIELMP